MEARRYRGSSRVTSQCRVCRMTLTDTCRRPSCGCGQRHVESRGTEAQPETCTGISYFHLQTTPACLLFNKQYSILVSKYLVANQPTIHNHTMSISTGLQSVPRKQLLLDEQRRHFGPCRVKFHVLQFIPAVIPQVFLPFSRDSRDIYSRPCGIPAKLASDRARETRPAFGRRHPVRHRCKKNVFTFLTFFIFQTFFLFLKKRWQSSERQAD